MAQRFEMSIAVSVDKENADVLTLDTWSRGLVFETYLLEQSLSDQKKKIKT